MRLASARLDSVYEVVTAIPAIGARPGDELIVKPMHPDFPFTLLRRFGLDVLPVIPDAAVIFVASYEPESDVPVSHEADKAARPALRLVR